MSCYKTIIDGKRHAAADWQDPRAEEEAKGQTQSVELCYSGVVAGSRLWGAVGLVGWFHFAIVAYRTIK